MTTQTQATIDYRDNCWFVGSSAIGGEAGFWTLAAAMSFTTNNLQAAVKLTNQAIVRKFKERS